MKQATLFILFSCFLFSCEFEAGNKQLQNNTAIQEQSHVEKNQSTLNKNQPSPSVSWSMERQNLINRFKMMNDRSVVFYFYVFNYGVQNPIGYYMVNKVSSVNSQLTNPSQVIITDRYEMDQGYGKSAHILESPQEDGSYGTNGDAVFGFTPDNIYIETNMQYITSNVPLNLETGNLLANITLKDVEDLNKLLDKIGFEK